MSCSAGQEKRGTDYRTHHRCRDIAAFLGRNPDVVSSRVGQGVRRRLDDPNLGQRLDALDRELAEAAEGDEGSTGSR
jgi:hypothetical protein